MLSTVTKTTNGIIKREALTKLDSAVIADAKDKFDLYVADGVILSRYEDTRWSLHNEVRKVNINFGYEKERLNVCCEQNGIKYEKLISSMKVFVILRLGTCSQDSLRDFVKYSISEIVHSEMCTKMCVPRGTNHGMLLLYYIELLQLMGIATDEYLNLCTTRLGSIRHNTNRQKKEKKHPCVLNEFQSYFKFDQIIRDYWNSCIDVNKKAFYYPLYLFWVITTILPMRVTEFCLMPLNCNHREGETRYISVRRSRLKGSSSYIPRVHYYRIEKDYYIEKYEIPQWLYDELENYKVMSENYEHPYNLLFSVDFLKAMDGTNCIRTDYKEKVFSGLELSNILREFYREVVCNMAGFSIVDENILTKRYLDEEIGSYEMYSEELMYIRPKHTRHLAMINLVMRGCNPMIIKEFAGHQEEMSDVHYYGNTSKLVRCATKYFYEKTHNTCSDNESEFVNTINPLALLIDETKPHVSVDGGDCYSEIFIKGSSDDCVKCNGKCKICEHFLGGNTQIEDGECEKVDKEILFLMKMLKSPRINEQIIEFQIRTQQLESQMANLATKMWKQLMENDNEQKI